MYSCEKPLHNEGTLKILKGTLAPEGAVIKIAGLSEQNSKALQGIQF